MWSHACLCTDLPNTSPLKKAGEACLDMFLPTSEDCSVVKSHFAVLVARVLVRHVPCLQFLQGYVPQLLPQDYAEEMKQASEIVSLT